MVVQNLHIDHDCEESLGTTPIPKEALNKTWTPYGLEAITETAFITIEVIFILIIIIGNSIIFVTIWRKASLRKPGFIYIASVAVSHFLVGGVVIPMYIVGHVPHQHLSSAQCKLVEYVSSLASAASPYSAVALAIHRFRERMSMTLRGVSNKQVVVDNIIVWGLSLVYASKGAILYDMVIEIVQEGDHLHCISICEVPHKHQTLSNYFLLFDTILLYLVPFLVTLILYMIVLIKIWFATNESDAQGVRRKDNLTKTIICFLITFFICYFGIYMWNMYIYWGPGDLSTDSLLWREILKLISFMTGWTNVVFVLCFNATVRKSVIRRKKRVKIKSPPVSPGKDSHEMNGGTKTDPPCGNDASHAFSINHVNSSKHHLNISDLGLTTESGFPAGQTLNSGPGFHAEIGFPAGNPDSVVNPRSDMFR